MLVKQPESSSCAGLLHRSKNYLILNTLFINDRQKPIFSGNKILRSFDDDRPSAIRQGRKHRSDGKRLPLHRDLFPDSVIDTGVIIPGKAGRRRYDRQYNGDCNAGKTMHLNFHHHPTLILPLFLPGVRGQFQPMFLTMIIACNVPK